MQSNPLPWSNIKTRGLTLIQFKRYMVKNFGVEETDMLIETLPKEIAEQVKFADRGAWYNFETQRLLREVIIARINPNDPYGVVYRMGLVTSSWDFSGFLRPLFSFLPLEVVLKQSAALWGKYYDKGTMVVAAYEGDHQRRALLELSDFPSDRYFCPIVTSWMMTALTTLKQENPKVDHTVCIHRGNDICRFELSWK